MQHYSYRPQGVCSRRITFGLENGKLYDVKFEGGCPGNTQAIGKLLEGTDARRAVKILQGNDCGGRGTSCADQLTIGIRRALEDSAKESGSAV